MPLDRIMRFVLISGLAIVLYACSHAASDVQAPDKSPQNVTATSKSQEVVVSWDPVANADYYVICWAYVPITTCEEGNPNVVYKILTDVTTWSHKNITNDTVYHYVVLAHLTDNTFSPISLDVSGEPQGVRAPTAVWISAYDNNATVSWDPVTDADSYTVYMDSMPGVTATNYNGSTDFMAHPLQPGQLSFTHPTPLTTGKTWYFVVVANRILNKGTANEAIVSSPVSQEVSVVPKAVATADVGHMPPDFRAKATLDVPQYSVNGSLVDVDTTQFPKEYIESTWTDNPNHFYDIIWSTQPFDDASLPACQPGINCISDATPAITSVKRFAYGLTARTQYYLALKTTYNDVNNQVQTSVTPLIGIKTLGVLPPPSQPVIEATAGVDSVTIRVISYNGVNPVLNRTNSALEGIKFNMYMVLTANFDTNSKTLSQDNYQDDIVWGMKHADILSNNKTEFTHLALPHDKEFLFVVTAENEKGEEGTASDSVAVTPLAPLP